jgi:hypothetical protein
MSDSKIPNSLLVDINPRELTHDEAQKFLEDAVDALIRLEDADRPNAYAVPKKVLTVGQAWELLSALIVVVAHHYPHTTIRHHPQIIELAALNFRKCQ